MDDETKRIVEALMKRDAAEDADPRGDLPPSSPPQNTNKPSHSGKKFSDMMNDRRKRIDREGGF